MQVELRKKYLDLLDTLRSYGSVAVAFSGSDRDGAGSCPGEQG